MMDEKRIRKYQAPQAVDLSGLGAAGQGPLGQCTTGSIPHFACTNGPDFQGACNPGGTPDTSACNAGGFHESPTCRTGSSAATICMSGSAQN